MHIENKSLLLALHIFFLIFMGHRIGIWLVCQLLYCLLSCGCICIYRVARCVCECVTVWVIVWVSAFVLFHSWKRAIIAQPNITDLILDRTTEWPQSNGEWRMATWFLQQISLFRYCVKTQHYSKIYAACVVCGWGLWFQILSTLTLASAFGIDIHIDFHIDIYIDVY